MNAARSDRQVSLIDQRRDVRGQGNREFLGYSPDLLEPAGLDQTAATSLSVSRVNALPCPWSAQQLQLPISRPQAVAIAGRFCLTLP